MKMFDYKNIKPQIGNHCFCADGSVIIGNCSIGDHVSIWFNTVLRGDIAKIEVGEGTNIQDLSILHITEGINLAVGKFVTVGHNVTLHSCNIADFCLIGMGSIIMDNVHVGKESLVAAGSLLSPGKTFGERKLIRGNPAREVRDLTTKEVKALHESAQHYINRKNEFLNPEIVSKI